MTEFLRQHNDVWKSEKSLTYEFEVYIFNKDMKK